MKHIVWHEVSITKEQRREKQKNHSFVLWFTGLSASGKSTLANAVAKKLFDDNIGVYVLDGDNIRHGLNKDLGFSREERQENIRRIGEVAKLFVDGGVIVLTAFISPFQEDRKQVRSLLEEGEFLEVFVKCPLEECEKRDPKGLYQKARQGVIGNFTGIHEPYEEPINPEIIVDTHQDTITDCVEQIVEILKARQYI